MRHCSFCSLLCSYKNENELDDCPLRASAIDNLSKRPRHSPTVDGHTASLDEALKAGFDYLRKASSVLVTGRIGSLEASREAVGLASSLSATIDLSESQSAFDWLQALQTGGAFTTTINEARFRSDLAIFAGDEADFANHPRILHQLFDSPDPLHKRRLLFLGNFSPDFLAHCKSLVSLYDVTDVESIHIPTGQLGDIFKAASAANLEFQKSSISDVVRQMQGRISESQHAVFVFSTTASYASGVEVYRSLNEFILNAASEKKVSALPLSSATLMFNQCCTWLTGFPGRLEFVDQVARYNPWLCKADKWIDRAGSDALIIFVDDCTIDAKITVSRARLAQKEVLLEIPIALSGSECFGTLYKADGSTMLSCGEASGKPAAGRVLEMLVPND